MLIDRSDNILIVYAECLENRFFFRYACIVDFTYLIIQSEKMRMDRTFSLKSSSFNMNIRILSMNLYQNEILYRKNPNATEGIKKNHFRELKKIYVYCFVMKFECLRRPVGLVAKKIVGDGSGTNIHHGNNTPNSGRRRSSTADHLEQHQRQCSGETIDPFGNRGVTSECDFGCIIQIVIKVDSNFFSISIEY